MNNPRGPKNKSHPCVGDAQGWGALPVSGADENIPTNLVVVDVLVLARFVPQGQFDSVPQS